MLIFLFFLNNFHDVLFNICIKQNPTSADSVFWNAWSVTPVRARVACAGTLHGPPRQPVRGRHTPPPPREAHTHRPAGFTANVSLFPIPSYLIISA